jgi:putative N6-adenine-specific DNA methylase
VHDLYAICAPGLEEASAEELSELGAEVTGTETGGVHFRATVPQAARLHLQLRTVVRVLLRLTEFKAQSRKALKAGLAKVPWDRYAPSGVRTSAHKSKLRHTGLLSDAVAEAARGLDGAAGEIYLRMDRDSCTVSVDMSGERLGHRGWRTDVGPAPLQETAAAALLRIAGWDRRVALLDPMCGSGVLPLEAAAWARGRPADRPFAFEQWPGLQRPEAETAPAAGSAPALYGQDRWAEAVDAARGHAAAAGFEEAVNWSVGELGSLRPPAAQGLIVCNPPWGKRLDSGDAYAELGRMLRRFKGWRAAVIAPRGPLVSDLEGTLGRGPDQVVPFRHGGVAVAIRIYERLGVRARSRRRRSGSPRRP